ncbi:MAG: hypothetical protein A3K66_03145 [Euryarchaeota archaeon RBG_16_67_27]|nr:MAG: hypothetical protein A3K66_03145 [Euryarchaeota archaeon RBG_16_67_27]
MASRKAHASPGETFLVSEIYPTIQGESSLVGHATVFVRLFGCNLRCVWCDSMHAVEGTGFRERTVDDVAGEIRKYLGESESDATRGIQFVCWTGGEPLLQWRSIARAISSLPGALVHTIETDGEIDLRAFDAEVRGHRDAGRVRYIMDVKCPGSGMTAKHAYENLERLRPIDEVKFVLADRRDYEFAKQVLGDRPTRASTILFSPVTPAHEVRRGLDPATLATWILEDRLRVRLQPQIHKYIWPGKERGV